MAEPRDDDIRPTGAMGKLREQFAPLAVRVAAHVRQNKLRAGLQAVAAVLVLLILGSVWSWLHQRVDPNKHEEITLEAALAALDQQQFNQARLIAEKLRYDSRLSPEELGGPLFVLGAAASYEADDVWGKEQHSYHLLAATYLEEAQDRGFPPNRRAEGVFLLGRSRYLSQQFASCIPLLEKALVELPAYQTEILGYLTGAYLAGGSPNYPQALDYNERYLADPKLPVAQRHAALLLRAAMLFELGESERCRQTLALIPPTSLNRGEVIVLEGRLAMREARRLQDETARQRSALPADETPTAAQLESIAEQEQAAAALYREAVKDFRRAQGQDNSGNVATRKALYLTGLCLMELGQDEAALVQLGKARRQYFESPEGVVAGLTEADLLRRLGRDEEALENYQRIIKQIADEVERQTYKNSWLSLDDFRNRLRTAYDDYRREEKFDQAVQLTDHLAMFFPSIDAKKMKAEAYLAWGEQLQAEAADKQRDRADEIRAEARQQFRQAGLQFVRLARLRVALREYPEDLWQAAQCFLLGHDYKSAITVFEEYLKNESRRRRAMALVGLGEARLALGELDSAIQPLNECLQQYPLDPVTYRARLLIAEALQEKGQTQEAIELLRENLVSLQLTPDSIEWRDSLFELGRLLYLAEEYEEAIPRLEEAVERYPDAAQTLESRYLIAEAYRQAAKEPIEKLETVTIESSRVAATAELKHLLGEALKHYKQVQVELSRRSDVQRLTELERAILRNCYFARGTILFDLGKYEAGAYEQAILAFSDATNIYQHEPEVLDAFLLIAACHRRLNKPVEARGALEQAKVVLSQMDAAATFTETTNFTREEWNKLLEWLTTL